MPPASCRCARLWNPPPERPPPPPSSAFFTSASSRWRSDPKTASPSPPSGLFNLSRLSDWWLRQGILIERIQPGRPQQNGRMSASISSSNSRPLDPLPPTTSSSRQGSTYFSTTTIKPPTGPSPRNAPPNSPRPSPRPYQGLPEPSCPFHDRTVLFTACGRLSLYRKKINLSRSLACQAVRIEEVDDGIWLVRFMDYDLGCIDLEENVSYPLADACGPTVSPMS